MYKATPSQSSHARLALADYIRSLEEGITRLGTYPPESDDAEGNAHREWILAAHKDATDLLAALYAHDETVL